MNRGIKDIIVVIIVALLLALLVGVVFSVVEAVDEYSGAAGLVTFLIVLLAGLFTDKARL